VIKGDKGTCKVDEGEILIYNPHPIETEGMSEIIACNYEKWKRGAEITLKM
jgi:hypothetical protein